MASAFETLLTELADALRPLVYAAEEEPVGSGLVRLALETGYDLDGLLTEQRATDFASTVSTAYAALRTIVSDPEGFAEQVPAVLEQVANLLDQIGDLNQLLPAGADLSVRLFDYLVAIQIEQRSPTLYSLLTLFGIVRETAVPESGSVPAYVRREVSWSDIARLVDPAALFADLYGWGTAALDSNSLLTRTADVLWATGLPARYQGASEAGTDGVLELIGALGTGAASAGLGLRGRSLAADGTRLPGIALVPTASATITYSTDLGGGWSLSVRLTAGASSGYQLMVRPRGVVQLGPAPGQPAVSWALSAESAVSKAASDDQRVVLLGSPAASRFEAKTAALRAYAEATNDSGDVGLEIKLQRGRLVVAPADGDGFLAKVLPSDGLGFDVDFILGWSSRNGLHFSGGAGLELSLPVGKSLGPFTVETFHLVLGASERGLGLEFSATGPAILGPVTVTVERFGLEATLGFPSGGGNLGPADFEMGFKGPIGAGIAIDAGVVVGAGYLRFDPARQEYVGVVQVEIAETLSVTGIGILTTRMPDGSQGFSLLIILSATFATAVQLGFGFSLQGVGGLIAVNRTVSLDALRAGLRAGSLGSILFPEDPVRNAPQIISDLRAIFPPAEGRYLIGPMARIAWGTPALLTIDLALVLEVPAPVRLYILGRLRALLPEERAPIVRLQVDAVGAIDFSTGDVSLDAVLYDSRVAAFAVTGALALRANFGANPNFALAVGGFNPRFQPPAGFPTLERVAISLATGDNPRLRLEAYLALTTNTVQFGARLELYARAGDFSLEGFLAFDALVQFDPFGFVVDIGASVALKYGRSTLMSVALAMTLSGPTPWHAWGQATFKLLFISASVSFDIQTGESTPPPLPAPVRIRPLLLDALRSPGNWATQFPPGEHPLVVLREDLAGPRALAHPLAGLEVRQRVAPLGVEVTRFGNTLPDGEREFTLAVIGADGVVRITVQDGVEPVLEQFAPAQFREMSDDEKLAAPAFEPMQSGVRFVPRGFSCGSAAVEPSIGYEEKTVVGPTPPPAAPARAAAPRAAAPRYQISGAFVEQVARTGSAGLAPLRQTGRARYQVGAPARRVEVRPPDFGVILERVGGPPTDLPVGPRKTYTSAMDALRKRLREHPEEVGRLRVVPFQGGNKR